MIRIGIIMLQGCPKHYLFEKDFFNSLFWKISAVFLLILLVILGVLAYAVFFR